jgi:hypothetical protein
MVEGSENRCVNPHPEFTDLAPLATAMLQFLRLADGAETAMTSTEAGMIRTVAGDARDALNEVKAEPEFLAQCQDALAAANRGSGESLRALIDLGRIGQAIIRDPSRWGPLPTKRRSVSAIDLVGRFLGAHRPTFRQAMGIVEAFTPEMLESLLSRYRSTGHLITVVHMRVLIQAESASQRAELIQYYYQCPPKPQHGKQAQGCVSQVGRSG